MEYQVTLSNIPQGKSFIVQNQRLENFSPMQVHPDFELNLVRRGNGRRIVGNNISFFENKDLILVGPNLPHCRELSETTSNIHVECLKIFISDKLINNNLTHIPELEPIRQLFSRALSGLAFKGKGVKVIGKQMEQLGKSDGFESYIALLQLLETLADIDNQEILSLTPELPVSKFKDLAQIKRVNEYVIQNIQDTITLETVSSLLNMAPGSFCRFFKKRTGKSFMQNVKDIRISLASKMLSDTEKLISQIASECGYNSLANFNFYFKNIMKMTPSDYRKNFR